MLITELKILHDEDKYNEYLAKIEKIKIEMAHKYLLHPSNNVIRQDDSIGNHNLHGDYRRSCTTLVANDNYEWDEDRIDIIGQNSNEGLHYEHV